MESYQIGGVSIRGPDGERSQTVRGYGDASDSLPQDPRNKNRKGSHKGQVACIEVGEV